MAQKSQNINHQGDTARLPPRHDIPQLRHSSNMLPMYGDEERPEPSQSTTLSPVSETASHSDNAPQTSQPRLLKSLHAGKAVWKIDQSIQHPIQWVEDFVVRFMVAGS